MFIKRIGTKKIIFSVDITIHSLKLALSMPVGINVI